MKSINSKLFQKKLLAWYKKSARDLPWRRTKDPYKIWVSEIMLQQTQVDTVIPYYDKWVNALPTIEALARAKEDRVLKLWSGLGYYRRARSLQKSAKEIQNRFGGSLPQSVEDLISLPGIGRYTAGAISSIAFDQKASLLDGNVIRVFSRFLALNRNVQKPTTIRYLWKFADTILPNHNIGDFNQALMELGATICTPTNPQCTKCPLRGSCKAFKRKKQLKYPIKGQRQKIQKKNEYAVVFYHEKTQKILLKKQGENERWGGLWAFPYWETKKALSKFVGPETKLKKITTIRHGFTVYDVQLTVYRANLKRKIKLSRGHWVPSHKLSSLPLPTPHRKITLPRNK